jgi:hypothetical protein
MNACCEKCIKPYMERCKKRCSKWVERTRYWEQRRLQARRARAAAAREYWDLIRLERRALPRQQAQPQNTEEDLDAFQNAWEDWHHAANLAANADAPFVPLPDDDDFGREPDENLENEPLGEGEGEIIPRRKRPYSPERAAEYRRREEEAAIRADTQTHLRNRLSINRHSPVNVRDNRVNRHVRPALKLKIPGPLQHKTMRPNPHVKGAKVLRTNPIIYRKKRYYKYN